MGLIVLSVFVSSHVFSRRQTSDGFSYSVFRKINYGRLFFLTGPYVLFLLCLPAVLMGVGVDTIIKFWPEQTTENFIVSVCFILFGSAIYSSLVWVFLEMKKDGFSLKEIKDMQNFSVNFEINQSNLTLKNTPDAQVIRIQDIVQITIRSRDIPSHYRNIRKEFKVKSMRLRSAESSERNPENLLSYDPFLAFLLSPPHYDLDIETDSKIVTFGADMALKYARSLMVSVLKDSCLQMKKRSKCEFYTEAYVLA